MKEMKKIKKNTARNVAVGLGLCAILVGGAVSNYRTVIGEPVVNIARKAGANDAIQSDVLENYTFTSDSAGVGSAGTIKDYSSQLKQIKLRSYQQFNSNDRLRRWVLHSNTTSNG